MGSVVGSYGLSRYRIDFGRISYFMSRLVTFRISLTLIL